MHGKHVLFSLSCSSFFPPFILCLALHRALHPHLRPLMLGALACRGRMAHLNVYHRSWRPIVSRLASVRCNHVDTGTLDFARRNAAIAREPDRFYPSLSQLPPPTTSVAHFLDRYANLDADRPENQECVRGRIVSVRTLGKNMSFVTLEAAARRVQLILNYNVMAAHSPGLTRAQFADTAAALRPGDHLQASGFPGVSQRERTLSLKCTTPVVLLAPATRPLPPRLEDPIKRAQNRVLDYLVNGHETLRLRGAVLRALREFLDARDFVEVETPMLTARSNGAAAEPFVTHARANDTRLELRVAPELWLKRLVVAGVDRVYELGRVFRNEGVDATHNPEFTTLEFYQAYASMSDLISLSEQLFLHVLRSVDTPRAHQLLEQLACNGNQFQRIEFLPTLQRETNIDFEAIDLSNPHEIARALKDKDIHLPSHVKSPQQMLNALCARYIESKYCESLLPTVIYHHPTVMSPLAKGNPADGLRTTKRFEIFICGKEYINAYEEENCPQRQLDKFIAQQKSHQLYGDKESLAIDTPYVEAMKWGMPPIGGFGLGVDRLCMLLAGKDRIEQVLSFGTIDDVDRQ